MQKGIGQKKQASRMQGLNMSLYNQSIQVVPDGWGSPGHICTSLVKEEGSCHEETQVCSVGKV